MNRLFATVVSYFIRTYSWHKFRVYIDIKSLQISFLGGRIFFKGVRYHGENETVYVHNGHITWRYWMRSTKQVDLSGCAASSKATPSGNADESEDGDLPDNSDTRSESSKIESRLLRSTESRIVVSVSGLEWFIYNRTPVYDNIVKEAGIKASSSADDENLASSNALSKAVEAQLKKLSSRNKRASDASSSLDEKIEEKDSDPFSTSSSDEPQPARISTDQQSVNSNASNVETDVSAFYSLILRFLPLGIDCSKGAVSIGNENTKAIIVTTFARARGCVDAAASGPADIFRQVFDFDVEHPVVQMKPNPDFHLPQMAFAERIIAGTEAVLKVRPWWRINLNFTRKRRKLVHNLRHLLPQFRRSVASLHGNQKQTDDNHSYTSFADLQPDSQHWHGLDRYMDEDEGDDHHAWAHIEYARSSTIIDLPHVHLNFYWDTPGIVQPEHLDESPSGLAHDLNGISPPAYGMHIDVYGGLVNYGPWSDRLRGELQNVFLPAGYRNAEPKSNLPIGDYRLSTIMDITIAIREEITLRIPSREGSKDWRWRGRATAVRDAAALRKQQQRKHFRFRRSAKRRLGPDVRPFGWISVAAGADSKIRYTMDMYPGIDGYRNSLQLSLKSTKATSSVNHATLWECKEQQVSADLSNPLGWNQLHTWRFDIKNIGMDLFLLRDHTFLLLDLISDFTEGLKSEYMTFMPFRYVIGIDFHNFNLFLNANDNNIIDNPVDFEENTSLVLGFAKLAGTVDIPMEFYSPAQSSVKFKGAGNDAKLSLKMPLWHTLHAFGEDDTMATIKGVQLEGSYNYFSATSPKLTDSLDMVIVGKSPKFNLQGFLIRYFMNVKDNYFGDTIHFSTLEEYQTKLDRNRREIEEEKKPPPKKQNDLDVILSVRADNSIALMPANIYRRDENLRVDVLLVEADMRFTNYYMDLQVMTSPIEVSIEQSTYTEDEPRKDTTGCQLFIDGASVYGHRLFGAPPTEPTYLCNWDFDVGEILGETSTDFMRIMIASIMSFIYTMDDDENALPKMEVEVIPDVTFLRMRAAGVRIWVVSEDTAFLVEVAATTVELNDWANQHFSKYVKVDAPMLLVAAVDGASAYRQRDRPSKGVTTHACFQTSAKLAVLNRKSDFTHNRALQQEHIRFHDSRTRRADWLLHKQYQHNAETRLSNWSRRPPAMPVPLMPDPVKLIDIPQAPNNHQDRPASDKSRSNSFLTSRPFAAHHSPRSGPVNKSSAGRLASHRAQELDQPLTSRTATTLNASSRNGHASTFSSPWVKPQFKLQQIRPDMSHMPKVSNPALLVDKQSYDDSMDDEDFPTSNDSFQHDGIFCNLAEGILGFCTPETVASVVTLLNEISPRKPESILDDLQMQVISNIKKLADKHVGQIDDMAFRLPLAHVRIISHHEQQNTPVGYDQYDLKLSSARATVRLAPEAHAKTLQTQILTHVTLKSLKIEVAECLPHDDRFISGAEISLREAGLWLSLRGAVRARAQMNDFEVVTAGKNINSLAGLIQRSRSAVLQAVQEFQRIDMSDRMQHLLYHLTSVRDVLDPPFLSRPAYVLRTADDHIRLHDSWAMISRLRNILAQWTKKHPAQACSADCLEEKGSEIREHILSSLEQWKSWQNAEGDDNALVQAIFGFAKQTLNKSQPTVDIEVEILLGRAAVTVDPGPNQSQASIQSLDLNVSEKVLRPSGQHWTWTNESRTARVVQGYCGTLNCSLNWELVDLAERVIDLTQSFNLRHSVSQLEQVRTNSPEKSEAELSIVVGADAASLQIVSPNLQLSTGVERFKTSFTNNVQQLDRTTLSLLLNATSGRLRIRSGKNSIVGCKITLPTIYASIQDDHAISSGLLVVHVASNCEKLRVHVKEDVLGLLRLARALLRDEVATTQHLIASIPTSTKVRRASPEPRAAKRIEPHIALFLNDYLMQFDLVSYLRYKISGTVARTSVVPHDRTRFTVQLDIKEHRHFFENPLKRSDHHKSALTMPPFTMSVTVGILSDRFAISAQATLERMLLEASAVRSCFDAAYQPQTIDYVKEIKHSITNLQESIKTAFPPTAQEHEVHKAKPNERQLQYNGHIILEGIRLHCNAPALRPDQTYSSDLNIVLASTTMVIHNRRPHSKALSRKPFFDFGLQQITIDLGRVQEKRESFGQLQTSFRVSGTTELDTDEHEIQNFHMLSDGIKLDLYAETIVLAADLVTFLQARIKSLAAAEDAKKFKPLRRLTLAAADIRPALRNENADSEDEEPMGLLDSTFSLELNAICLRWLLNHQEPETFSRASENVVLSVNKIDLRTKREASARLIIRGLQLQLVPQKQLDPFDRTANSALLPEMVFNAAYARGTSTRKFAFKAAGKLLDVKLASNFIVPAAAVQKSLASAASELRTLKLSAAKTESDASQAQLPKIFGKKRLASLLVFADFGGAEVTVSPAQEGEEEHLSAFGFLKGLKRSRAGRYGQAVSSSTGEEATLRAPGIAFQVEYSDDGSDDPTLSTEIRVAASSNTLAPSVVPLILEISSSVTNLMNQENTASQADTADNEDKKDDPQDTVQQTTDPTALLGKVKLNAELWVQKQEFSLTCQPIARVSATARFDEIFVVVNTVQSKEQERFFSIMTTFRNLAASVQHVYSRESTASFAVDSIIISLMNSKHFSDRSGISAILDISPIKAYLNAKQMQDFLLFREIWYPAELRSAPKAPTATVREGFDQGPAMQRFHEATSTAVLPWHAIASIHELRLQIDCGQSIGKSDFVITKLWASSQKSSGSEQNLCIGFDKIGIESAGRMSGFVELQGFRVRTAIRWPIVNNMVQAPLVQGSVGFEHLRAKAVFDYQPFAVVDISTFDFLIYNVRQGKNNDRLVGILDGGKIQAFCTTAAASQGLSISQAFERLIQEKQEAFETSLHELDKYLRRKSVFPSNTWKAPSENEVASAGSKATKSSHAPQLHVDVVITMRAIDAGVFMSSFFDEMTLKLEAVDVQTRFAVGTINGKTHSGLGMSLGQVRVALSNLARPNAKALGEVLVTEVIERATVAKGGTILKVPRLVASMETWQQASSNVIEYVFQSIFQGKVDIGWNYSRISTIRRMWESHSRALAKKMNKPLPPSAIKITAEPKDEAGGAGQEKITAVVNMPQSKYEYIPVEPPIIDTPQLRDLGEATPSLEWIGLHRERLPHVTHSVIIVSLLELSKEVEDSYSRILGSG